jgi:hypothetical protein
MCFKAPDDLLQNLSSQAPDCMLALPGSGFKLGRLNVLELWLMLSSL